MNIIIFILGMIIGLVIISICSAAGRGAKLEEKIKYMKKIKR
ncbi:hypothetical protein [Clostridium sp. 19966]|nr:hypothetical protein [Clostridium sp. 19966]